MLRRMRDEEFEPEEHDTEITLGPAMLLAIACGLVLLCAICFILGYRTGRGSGTHAATVTQTSTGQTVTATTDGSISKPQAKNSMPAAVPQPVTAAPLQSMGSTTPSQPNPLTSYAPATTTPAAGTSAPAESSNQSVVRPALPNPSAGSATSQSGNPSSSFMVQVAAVSRVEDANVLMNALRKRGYAVSARHVLTDNLIHVQVGPFNSRADASATSQRLLGDGYNAVVIP